MMNMNSKVFKEIFENIPKKMLNKMPKEMREMMNPDSAGQFYSDENSSTSSKSSRSADYRYSDRSSDSEEEDMTLDNLFRYNENSDIKDTIDLLREFKCSKIQVKEAKEVWESNVSIFPHKQNMIEARLDRAEGKYPPGLFEKATTNPEYMNTELIAINLSIKVLANKALMDEIDQLLKLPKLKTIVFVWGDKYSSKSLFNLGHYLNALIPFFKALSQMDRKMSLICASIAPIIVASALEKEISKCLTNVNLFEVLIFYNFKLSTDLCSELCNHLAASQTLKFSALAFPEYESDELVKQFAEAIPQAKSLEGFILSGICTRNKDLKESLLQSLFSSQIKFVHYKRKVFIK